MSWNLFRAISSLGFHSDSSILGEWWHALVCRPFFRFRWLVVFALSFQFMNHCLILLSGFRRVDWDSDTAQWCHVPLAHCAGLNFSRKLFNGTVELFKTYRWSYGRVRGVSTGDVCWTFHQIPCLAYVWAPCANHLLFQFLFQVTLLDATVFAVVHQGRDLGRRWRRGHRVCPSLFPKCFKLFVAK